MTAPPRLLVIGAGSIGARHLRCFGETGRCSLVFCEPNEARRAEVAGESGSRGFASWEEAVAAEEIDAAVIAAPPPWHVPTANALAERGIHLLIEKPLALGLEGIGELVEVVERKGVRAAVGFVYRSLPALRRLRDEALAGAVGRLVQVQVQAGQHFPYYRPAYRELYYADPQMGGGLIQDMLPHPLNAVEWIVGPATRVVADAAHAVLPGVGVENTVNVLTRHGEVMGCFSLNQHQPVNEFVITVHGDRGSLRWEMMRHRWLSAAENGGKWTERESFEHGRDDFYRLQANAFLDFLEGKAEAPCPLGDGIATLRSTLAVLESRKSGRWIEVEPAAG